VLEWAKIYVDCRIAAQTRICETTQLNQLAIPCCNVTSGMLYSHAIGFKFFNILSSGERCSVNFGLLRRALHYWHNPGHCMQRLAVTLVACSILIIFKRLHVYSLL